LGHFAQNPPHGLPSFIQPSNKAQVNQIPDMENIGKKQKTKTKIAGK